MTHRSLVFILLILISCVTANAQPAFTNTPVNNSIDRPPLIIGIVVDQMRWDYLYRYANHYGKGGFKRLLKGYSFENTMIPYSPAVTAAGHTCIYTGSVPAIHGIVGNDWIERNEGTYMYCTQDKSVSTVGSNSLLGQMSPKNLLLTTIGDELRLATNFRSRVFGIALKDRGGIVAAGRSANAAYWFDDSTGNWITSTWYMQQLPGWVNNFNSSRKADSIMSNDWNLLYGKDFYEQSTEDDMPFEKTLLYEKNKTFPHRYKHMIGKSYYDLRVSPFGNTLTLDFAKKLIENEKLGASGQTDMLCISLSATDYISHRFGPNSLEVEDTYLRLDKDIEVFLNYLDKTAGKNNYLIFLSADHGAPSVPALMKAHKMSAGHLNAYYGLRDSLNRLGFEKFGVPNLVNKIFEYQVYIDMKKVSDAKSDLPAIKNAFVKYLNERPEVVIAFDYANFEKLILPAKQKEMLIRGYYPKRSGDIQFILKPQFTDVSSSGTEHGTIYNYDTHIPLVWYGWKIKSGSTHRETYMTDIAPTIAALLKIQMPNGSVGNVLPEIIP